MFRDITKENQIMPFQRIKDLPLHMQVHAQMRKGRQADNMENIIIARTLSTNDVQNLVEGIDRDTLITSLCQCAHLVKGIKHFHSCFLFCRCLGTSI